MTTPSPSSETREPTVAAFLKAVLRSGLLDKDRLQEALRGTPRAQRDDPHALAERLVKSGHLSRFQARKLLKGHALGLVLGPYQILAPLGKGGMGTVFLARDARSAKLIALKVLPPRRARTEERLLARFRREMELSQRVAHPHLAWTYETGTCLGVNYLAMEYIPGKSLSRLVTQEGPLRVARAARLMAEVASALEHAHNQGMVHRDLKPSNILITPHDHAKVLDLGLALMKGEAVEDNTIVGGHGYIVGTMDYIAPEQTTDSAGVDGRADIYSLGCTVYYALTGQPPFPGGTSREKIYRHRGEEPVPLTERLPSIPPAFAALVHKMMAKDPAQRFPSAIAVEEELRAWATDETPRPLDQPEDAAFAQAVSELQAAEPSTEYTLAEIVTAPAETEEDVGDKPPSSFEILLPPVYPDWLGPLIWTLAGLAGLLIVALLVQWLLGS